MNELNFNEGNYGDAIEVYVASNKKNLLALSMVPTTMRKKKSKKEP